MQMYRCPMPECAPRRGRKFDAHIETLRRRMHGRRQHPVAARNVFFSTPARLSAQRCPAWPDSEARFCAWMLRTRTSLPDGDTTSLSPTCTRPANTVPVTTVPLPVSVKQRSTARRKFPSSACDCRMAAVDSPMGDVRGGSRAARRFNCFACLSRWRDRGFEMCAQYVDTIAVECSIPETPDCRPAGCRRATVRSPPAPRPLALPRTRSILVSATAPCEIPSRSTISRCSRVCGIRPSSAAITSSTKSMPVAPASMLCTKRSWPGTSINPSTSPFGSGAKA